MGWDVWFREDVARVLQAARVSGREAQSSPGSRDGCQAAPSREMIAYWRGYEAALATIGAAFGLTSGAPLGPAGDRQPALSQSRSPDAGGDWE